MENLTNYFLSKQFHLFHDYDYSLLSQSGGKNNKKRWDKLYHNGPMFPDDYVPHNIPVKFKNESIVLPSEGEEYATVYAKYIDSEYIKNKKFNKNFWNDWKHMVKNTKITNLEECDFSLIQKHILVEKEKKMNISKEERTKLMEGRKIQEQPFLFATIDGKKEKIGNFKIEPPGIFIGRGCHPLLGSIKPRILPQDITLNLSKDAPIPNSVYGNKWGEIIHDPYVDWLASYLDIISGKTKYIWLSASSSWKMENDQEKFDLSRKLKRKIKSIRDDYSKLLKDTLKNKQIATCIYFIDYLALRVGNEKGAEESDTVGITSLRVEHLTLMEDLNIKLDFLGKDSVRYVKVIRVDEQVYNNLITFIKNKDKNDNIFDLITTNDLNKYLQSLMDGLTAKVFRTYNASTLFYDELFSIKLKETMNENEKMDFLLDKFNQANIKVASLCNHQKNVQKNFKEQITKIDEDINELKNKKKQEKSKTKLSKLNTKIKKLKSKKELKLELKNISLGTSKINYIDPRITVAWIKKYNFPVEKIFSETLREKFAWAFDVDETFVY
jgi:DNA topoisomerase-1